MKHQVREYLRGLILKAEQARDTMADDEGTTLEGEFFSLRRRAARQAIIDRQRGRSGGLRGRLHG